MPQPFDAAIVVAGFDPSAGAGLLSDIKTFENNGVYAFGVCTAITFQNALHFDALKWLSNEDIIQQINIVAQEARIKVAKIGLIKDPEMLTSVTRALKKINPDIHILWDPIFQASAGWVFHSEMKSFQNTLRDFFLITPNIEETLQLSGMRNQWQAEEFLSQFCAVLITNASEKGMFAIDRLYYHNEINFFSHAKLKDYGKHGSGCVLSSALAAFLCKGYDLIHACRAAKKYTYQYMKSTKTLLGHHHSIFNERQDN